MINLNISKEVLDDLTWEEWELVDNATYTSSRKLLAKFIVGVDGKPLPKDEAMAALGKLKTADIKSTLELFTAKIKELGAINPTTDGN
jgi:hypothetical protein